MGGGARRRRRGAATTRARAARPPHVQRPVRPGDHVFWARHWRTRHLLVHVADYPDISGRPGAIRFEVSRLCALCGCDMTSAAPRRGASLEVWRFEWFLSWTYLSLVHQPMLREDSASGVAQAQ